MNPKDYETDWELRTLIDKYRIKVGVYNGVFLQDVEDSSLEPFEEFVESAKKIISSEKMVKPHIKLSWDSDDERISVFIVDDYTKTDDQVRKEIKALQEKERANDIATINTLRKKWGL